MFNTDDFILRKRGFLSEESCRRIINFFEKNPDRQKEACTVDGVIDSSHRKYTEMIVESTFSEQVFNLIHLELKSSKDEYKNRYPILDDRCYSWDIYPTFKIQKYEPSEGYFTLHCENDGHVGRMDDIHRRLLAWMIYLNDVNDDGYTEFPYQKKKFQPRRGDLLIWPAYFTHPHRGITSKTETKYILTGWYWFLNKWDRSNVPDNIKIFT
tara:strand:- start:293 stop:925 length:633 start_codon:yes stop_codon:yes gene_type:complete